MLGELNNQQIEHLLQQQVIGRLGCHADGEMYIVPVNYVYHNSVIYAHSAFGKKIAMMRKNPAVCFEVDVIQNVFSWQSVIAWGQYEEITDIAEKEQVMQRIIHNIMPLVTRPSGHPSHGITENESDIGDTVELIIYKIVLTQKSGRFEKG